MKHRQQDYADRLSDALMKGQRIMLLFDNYLNGNKKANLLKDLESLVYDDKDHWEAMHEVIGQLYPGLTATLQLIDNFHFFIENRLTNKVFDLILRPNHWR